MKNLIKSNHQRLFRLSGFFILTCILLSLILLTSRCYYDSKEYLYPQITNVCADTVNAVYSGSISTILSNHCVSCHNASVSSKNVRLDNYTDVKIQVDNGQFLKSIIQDPSVTPMPPGDKLLDCEIIAIKKWLTAGALNN